MTAVDKAKELINRFDNIFVEDEDEHYEGTVERIAKQCALIAVDEIILSEPRYPSDVDWDDVGGTHQYYYEAQRESAKKYWNEVKNEITKL
jgi:hypothetical protein